MNKKKLILSAFLVLFILPTVLADSADLNTPLSPADKAKFDQILQPVMKIYNFVKYIASVVAAIFLLYAGISYMSSGGDPRNNFWKFFCFIQPFVEPSKKHLIGLFRVR